MADISLRKRKQGFEADVNGGKGEAEVKIEKEAKADSNTTSK